MSSRRQKRREGSSGAAGRNSASPRLLSTALVTLLLAGPALVLHFSSQATGLLAFRRGLIASGEVWRWITGHWTHWSTDHLRWDLLAFAVLVPLCWRFSPWRMLGTLAASALLIPAAVWIAIPTMVEYRGLSGLDSALFVLLGVSLLRDELRSRSYACAAVFGLALAGFTGKIGYEMISDSTLFVADAGFIPVPLAHMVGGLCGLFFALIPKSTEAVLNTEDRLSVA